MRTGYAFFLFFTCTLMPAVSANFALADSYVGEDFFRGWRWETFDDPTHGRVNYVDQSTAMSSNLSYADKFVMRADDFKIVSPDQRGRDSVRIQSYKAYEDSVTVLDLQHMPEGCGTWPAFWTLSQTGPWPEGGEIDIVEGTNQNTQNLASMHTKPECTMDQQRFQSGAPTSNDCDTSVNYNQGCGVSFAKPSSYGAPFNAVGGGFFVMARTQDEGVRIWFWTRDDPAVPAAVRGSDDAYPVQPMINPDPSWGLPEATFPVGDTCEYDSHLDPHAMVFDLTFCGDWASAVYTSAGCPGSCVDLVNNNPTAFTNAYWEINSVRVYTPDTSLPILL